MRDLFPEPLPDGVILKPGALTPEDQRTVLSDVRPIAAQEPFRHLTVRSGAKTSAALTNCGEVGWWSDRQGYRYTTECPDSGKPWPDIPKVFQNILVRLLADTPIAGFSPDVCLINRYDVGARLGLHQDLDEADRRYPIVTWSLGLTGDFILGGLKRQGPTRTLKLESGDVVILHGPGRMLFHGVRKVHPGTSPMTDLSDARVSLTFRRAR